MQSRSFRQSCLGPSVGGVAFLVAIIGVIAVLFFTRSVDAGEVCVKTEFGKVRSVVQEGLHFNRPTESYHCYSKRTTIYETSDHAERTSADFSDDRVDTQTSDGQRIEVSYSVLWHIDAENAALVYRDTGKTMEEVNERAVKAASRSLVRNILTQYTAEELFSSNLTQEDGTRINTRLLVQKTIETALALELKKQGVTLEALYLRSIDFDEDYVAAIEEKEIAEERVDTARQNAEATRLQAQGEADAIRIVGEALREYPEVLQQEFIKNADFSWGIMPFDGIQPLIPLDFSALQQNTESEATPTP